MLLGWRLHEGGAWTGDIGYNCDQNWYAQSEIAGKMKDGGDYYPKCTWFDSDHSNEIPTAAMKFKADAYGPNVTDTLKNDQACKFTNWGPDNGPIDGR